MALQIGGMSFEEFLESVSAESPPDGASCPLAALWWDRKGDWDKAHDEAQAAGSKDGDWVHAYLHRKEGDVGNAGYWYSRAGKPAYEGSLDAEWKVLVEELLAGDCP